MKTPEEKAAYAREWRLKNPDKLEASKERSKAAQAKWRAGNKEKKNANARAFRAENRETVNAAHRAYYAKTRPRRIDMHRAIIAASPEAHLLSRAKYRARKNELEFDITVADVVIPATCPVLGLVLSRGFGKAAAGSPTLDRIDNSKGYVKGNVVVISWRANALKRDATLEEMRALAAYYGALA